MAGGVCFLGKALTLAEPPTGPVPMPTPSWEEDVRRQEEEGVTGPRDPREGRGAYSGQSPSPSAVALGSLSLLLEGQSTKQSMGWAHSYLQHVFRDI